MGGRIVVGMDGSPGSEQALRWAAEEARRWGAALQVVRAWHVLPVGDVLVAPSLELDLQGESEQALAVEVKEVLDDHPDLPVTLTVREGPAATVLLEAAEGADLLVVGSRGRGGFTGLLLGSVGQQCTHHARCPVAVVPGRWGPDGASGAPVAG